MYLLGLERGLELDLYATSQDALLREEHEIPNPMIDLCFYTYCCRYIIT